MTKSMSVYSLVNLQNTAVKLWYTSWAPSWVSITPKSNTFPTWGPWQEHFKQGSTKTVTIFGPCYPEDGYQSCKGTLNYWVESRRGVRRRFEGTIDLLFFQSVLCFCISDWVCFGSLFPFCPTKRVLWDIGCSPDFSHMKCTCWKDLTWKCEKINIEYTILVKTLMLTFFTCLDFFADQVWWSL